MDQSQSKFATRFLGPVAVECDGQPVEMHLPRKGLALLAYLSVMPGITQSRRKLAELLWPELPEEAARSNLRQVLLGIKRGFQKKGRDFSCLVSDRNSVRLEITGLCFSDVARFLDPLPECTADQQRDEDCLRCLEKLEAISCLYRGQFLENLVLADSLDFEDWQQAQRESLQQRALFILERLADCLEERGMYDKALVYAQRFLELSPWSDEGLRRVIRLAALNGQRGFALSRYQDFCRTIKDELGVRPEEKTRKLAQKIQSGGLLPDGPGNTAQSAPVHRSPQRLEKRQMTVCYYQFVSAAEQDPEDDYERLQCSVARCEEILGAGSGYVMRSQAGSGLLAYFGYPSARENAALQAVRSALSLVVGDFPVDSVRVGIYTGTVLSADDMPRPDIAGRVSDRAFGLSAMAGNGEIIVSETTRRLVKNYFVCSDFGEHVLPGSGRKENCYKVEREIQSNDGLNPTAPLTPFMGRDQEIERLKRIWQSTVLGGRLQALLLQGEPGIGKSRLVRIFKESLYEDSVVTLEFRGQPEFSESPFHPMISSLRSLLGLSCSDSVETHLYHLSQALQSWRPKEAGLILPLAAELLDSEIEMNRQRREQVIVTLVEMLRRLAEERPVLLIVEDLHWIDPTTLELLSGLIRNRLSAPVFLLLTARPEFEDSWAENELPRLFIEPLSDEEIGRIIAAKSPRMPSLMHEEIINRADGIPLFAEELSCLPIDFLSEKNSIIPSTLHDLLASRLDTLSEDKKLAQLAATIGREFHADLLTKLLLMDEPQVEEALFRLKNAGLLSNPFGDCWQFRHALIRDAAYSSQARADRESSHLRIARILEVDFPHIAAGHPELLAYHWGSAGEIEPAVKYRIQAGLQAQGRSAHHEAVGHFKTGLELLSRLTGAGGRQKLEWQLQVGLGASAYAVEGYASSQGAAAYHRALELGEGQKDIKSNFPALWGLWAGASSHSNWAHSLRLAKRLVQIVKNGKDPVSRQQGYFAMGNVEFWRGEFENSRRCLERAVHEYRSDQHPELISGYGENCFATSGSYLSWTLCLLGLPRQAMQIGERALDEARRTGHPFSLGYALTFHTVLHRILRQPRNTLTFAEQTIDLALEHNLPLWEVGATLKKGWAQVVTGDLQGLDLMQWSVERVSSLMSSIAVIFFETQADGLYHAGRFREALDTIDRGLEQVERLDDHHAEAELYRLKGGCLLELSPGNLQTAEDCFRRALQISRRQKALLFELRAAMALADLRARRLKTQEDLSALAHVYNQFSEGLSFPDLVAAQRRLAEVNV